MVEDRLDPEVEDIIEPMERRLSRVRLFLELWVMLTDVESEARVGQVCVCRTGWRSG